MDKYQLLILGNGFDLHCGLKSSYKDFFRIEILDTIGEQFDLQQLKRGQIFGFWESLLLEYYKLYGSQDYNWCDVEKIIKDTLLSIHFGKSKEKLNQGICFQASLYVHNFHATLHLEEFNSIELFLFNYCVKFISANGGEFKDIIKPLTENLFEQLHNLEQRFCKYLKNQIGEANDGTINEKYVIKATNLLTKLTGFAYYEFNNLDDVITVDGKNRLIDVFGNLNDVFILNFNYTALFDILEVESPCYHNNVHGKLCNERCTKGCKISNIIFGIDDSIIQSQGTSSELRSFSKTYRKMLNSDNYILTLPPNEEKPLDIKFYGHSLSEADYSYFQSIFDYYDLYSNSNVSLIFYYSKGFENHDAVYKLISAYGKSLTNKEQGKNLIHKLLLENRLHIQEVKE